MEEERRRASQSTGPGSCSSLRRFKTVLGGDVWKQLTAATVAQTCWFFVTGALQLKRAKLLRAKQINKAFPPTPPAEACELKTVWKLVRKDWNKYA